jgi:MYXO-CTERM domain-containing protein
MRGCFLGIGILCVMASAAFADPIISEDFESITTADFTQTDFSPTTGSFDTWHTQPANWIVNSSGGPGGAGDAYAQHLQNTVRLFEGTALSPGELPAGTLVKLDFDFIYEDGFTGITQAAVLVLGLNAGDASINVFAPFNDPGTTLYSAAIAPPLVSKWTHFSDSFVMPAEFDAIAIVFTNGAFGSNADALRGIDNVSLASVPEPPAILLAALGLVAAGAIRRRRLARS